MANDETGIGSRCTRGDEVIVVVLDDGATATGPVEAGDYLRTDAFDSPVYQFSTAKGFWRCSILVDRSVAGCSGTMPSNAPQVRNNVGTTMTTPNGVEVGDAGSGKFVHSGDPRFWPMDGSGFITGRDLPAGASLTASGFTCTAITGGVRCETTSGDHGFEVERDSYHLW